jgi:hypothetical protein
MKRFKLSHFITVNGHYFYSCVGTSNWGQKSRDNSPKSKESKEALGDNLDVFDCSGWRKLSCVHAEELLRKPA